MKAIFEHEVKWEALKSSEIESNIAVSETLVKAMNNSFNSKWK